MLKSFNIMKNLQQLTGKMTSIIMAGSNSHITILTLNINGLNAPIKRNRLANWIESRPISVLYSRDPPRVQTHTEAQNKEME